MLCPNIQYWERAPAVSEKVLQKAWLNVSKSIRLTYNTEVDWLSFFCHFGNPAQSYVVNVNSLCQQGGLFAHSVNSRGVTIHRYIDTMYDDTMHA